MSKVGAFTIGADPEVALVDITSGTLKSAIGLIKGTKCKPEPFDNGGNIQRDNVAAEFGIAPSDNSVGFLAAIRGTMERMLEYLPKNIQFVKAAAIDFPASELEHPEAKEFGCDPDYNAWDWGAPFLCSKEDKRSVGLLRSFGGHIHVGYVEGSGNDFLNDYLGKMALIQVMDCLLGIYSVIADDTTGSQRRRELYGKAGAFRSTPYGVEYRVLSNFWIFDDNLVNRMYDLVDKSLTIMRNGKYDDLIEAVGPENIQNCINTGNREQAHELWEKVSQFIEG